MTSSSPSILGWPPKGWFIVTAWLVLLLSVDLYIVAQNGISESVLSQIARFHVRAAFLAFWLVFAARPLIKFFPRFVPPNLLRYRPYIGVCFATAHFGFLLTNIMRVRLFYDGQPFELTGPLNWLLGGLLYAVIFAMAVTSFPIPACLLGPRGWQILHAGGCYLVALTYLNSFGLRALFRPEYITWAVLVLVLLSLRLAFEWQRHNSKLSTAIKNCCNRYCGIGSR